LIPVLREHESFLSDQLRAQVYIIKVKVRTILLAALALMAQALGAAPKVIAVNVDGMVHPITAEIVGNAIVKARAGNAALVLIRLNTPGGLMDAMRATIERMAASPVPVVTFVAPSGGRAASAGFFLLEAGDLAAMAPGTATGAAHPVMMGAQMDPVMKQKVENDAAAYLRSICTRRGRNTALAETAVRESRSFTEREALEQKLVDVVAADERQLSGRAPGAPSGRAVSRRASLRRGPARSHRSRD
jgi:membrane-bound serine protease (ClpP class)